MARRPPTTASRFRSRGESPGFASGRSVRLVTSWCGRSTGEPCRSSGQLRSMARGIARTCGGLVSV
eukprot:4619279-Pyramimonas_sp.AAC.1